MPACVGAPPAVGWQAPPGAQKSQEASRPPLDRWFGRRLVVSGLACSVWTGVGSTGRRLLLYLCSAEQLS